jgi:hypothetical protein
MSLCAICKTRPGVHWRWDVCGDAECKREFIGGFRDMAERAVVRSLPPRHQPAAFGVPDLARWVRPSTAVASAQDRPDALASVFLGPAGSGKTTLAVARLRMLVRAEVTQLPQDDFAPAFGLFIDARDLVRARLEHRLGDGEAKLVERARDIAVLAIDELGAEVGRGTGENVVAEIIHHRHAYELPTVIATPFTPTEIESKYGAGVARRLFEAGHAHVVQLGKARGAR